MTDMAICRAMLRGGSRSFFAASLLLPRRVRESATALYAFCRLADDAMDLHAERDAALTELHRRLTLIYEGRPCAIAADRALAEVVARYRIPRPLLDALLEGFAWDAGGRRYEDLPALQAYAARVAGTVGVMMAILMGVRSPEALARACDLGIAMQLTNIARDVGEDARAARLYLPLRWLREAGIDPDAWLAQPVFDDALGSVVDRMLRVADELYRRAGQGIAALPIACRPGMHAACLLYREIGHQLRRQGLDSVARRAIVPPARKLWWLAGATIASLQFSRQGSQPPLEEARFLVDAGSAGFNAAPAALPWWRLTDRIVWLIGLFERLERLERARGIATVGP